MPCRPPPGSRSVLLVVTAQVDWPTVSARYFDRMNTYTPGPASMSNNPLQESPSTWLLASTFFDTQHLASLRKTTQHLLTAPRGPVHRVSGTWLTDAATTLTLQPQHDGPVAAWPARPVVLHPGTLHERLPWGGHREGRAVARRDRPP